MYRNALASNYEELKTYYPVWYRDIKEMDAVWQVHGRQLDSIQGGISDFTINNIIATADVESITRWERFLGITYDSSRSLDERRAMVASFFVGKGHIGEPEIKELFETFTDGAVSAKLIGGNVWVYVVRDLDEQTSLSDYFYVLEKRLPAHLDLKIHDIALPIPLDNLKYYQFRFENLALSLAFHNFGQPIRFNGERSFGGELRFNQGIAKGLHFPQIYIGLMMGNRFSLSSDIGYGLQIESSPVFTLSNLDMATGFYNFGQLMQFDGSADFNGSLRFDQRIAKGLNFPELCIGLGMRNPLSASSSYGYGASTESKPVFALDHLAMSIGLYNFGRITQFDGSTDFDGSLWFDQRIAKGLNFTDLHVRTSVHNHSELDDDFSYVVSVNQKSSLALTALTVAKSCETKNQICLAKLGVDLKVKNPIGQLSGSLLTDSMRYMDGSHKFDGSHMFDAEKTEEDI